MRWIWVRFAVHIDRLVTLANALNSSATIFETLSDIDAKFAKLMDKEYDSISAEVKKWFKKLAVRIYVVLDVRFYPFFVTERREGP